MSCFLNRFYHPCSVLGGVVSGLFRDGGPNENSGEKGGARPKKHFHPLTLFGAMYFLHDFSRFFSMAPLVSWATFYTFKGTKATAFLSSL